MSNVINWTLEHWEAIGTVVGFLAGLFTKRPKDWGKDLDSAPRKMRF